MPTPASQPASGGAPPVCYEAIRTKRGTACLNAYGVRCEQCPYERAEKNEEHQGREAEEESTNGYDRLPIKLLQSQVSYQQR